ncbi:flap endonuclease-1 [Thermoproteota archaeon]
MGVHLTPIIQRRKLTLDILRGNSFAVDGFIVLHEFLALIRDKQGRPLTDSKGNITSHLVGLAFRTTRLISDYDMNLVFVFDGKPPALKREEIATRREIRRRAEEEYKEAVERGDIQGAFSKAVMTGKLTKQVLDDAKRLLDLLGIPRIQAPSEGEAQAAYMAQRGDVWASNSKDYDSLLFGAPRLVRFLSINSQEWLPNKGRVRRVLPELIELSKFLGFHGITRTQLIDMGILIGTDFNSGIRGIGPKTALKLIKKHGTLEGLPAEIGEKLPDTIDLIRDIYMNPEVTEDYNVKHGELQEEALDAFLCGEKNFSTRRVQTLINRMRRRTAQRTLIDYFGGRK